MGDILKCIDEPCMCWGDDVYEPSEDSWLAWELVEGLPEVGGIGADVGTGSCVLSNIISEKVDFVVALDVNPYAARACRFCKVEALLCNSMTCFRKGVNLVVANLPYLPCEDDRAVCWKWGLEVLKGIKVLKGGYLVLVWSSLTPKNPLSLLRGFETVKLKRVSLGFEELIGAVLIKRTL